MYPRSPFHGVRLDVLSRIGNDEEEILKNFPILRRKTFKPSTTFSPTSRTRLPFCEAAVRRDVGPEPYQSLADLFPGSQHLRGLGLKQTPGTDVWQQAKQLGYVIVTKDKDFANLSLVWGAPPKVIQLQLGNCSVQQIEDRLRRDAVLMGEFVATHRRGYWSSKRKRHLLWRAAQTESMRSSMRACLGADHFA